MAKAYETVTGIKVYWDGRHADVAGWAYEVTGIHDAGDGRLPAECVLDSGDCQEDDPDTDPAEMVVDVASQNDIEITRDDVVGHEEDGGWAEWRLDWED